MIPGIISFKKNSDELKSALWEGTLSIEGQLCRLIPREVLFVPSLEVPGAVGSVVFEVNPENQFVRPSRWKIILQAIRPLALGMSVFPFLVVLANGGWELGLDFSRVSAVVLFFVILLVQVSVHLSNDVQDHLRLVDRPGMVGGSGVIQKGWGSARILSASSAILALSAFQLCFRLIHQDSLGLYVLGAIGFLGAFQFSSPPFSLKYRSWGDAVIFLLGGPVLVLGVAQLLFHRWDWADFSLGLFFGGSAWAFFHSKRLQSFESDQQGGVSNWATLLGFKRSRHFLVMLYGLTYFSLLGGVIWTELPARVLCASLLALPLIFRQVSKVYRASGPVSVYLGQLRSEGLVIQFCLGTLALLGFLLKF